MTALAARPASYREVLSVREYRALFTASVLSWAGDMLARVAVSFLIFQNTRSVVQSAAAFAITYAPWILGGPFLAAIAERYSYRRVMIFCDVGRAVLMALIAIPGMSCPVMLMLLLGSAFLTPSFDAARSALLPHILTGDRYVVGLSLQNISAQLAQISGYVAGGALVAISPKLALLANATTFAASAVLVYRRIQPRPAALRKRTTLLRETIDGYRLVFGQPVTRLIAFTAFTGVAFSVLPEGLAAAWVSHLHGGGWGTGLLMATYGVGLAAGGVFIGRLVAPRNRERLIRPLAIAAPFVLVLAVSDPPLPVVLAIGTASGFAMAYLIPLNAMFVQAVPDEFRARGFGVMQAGLQIMQGAGIMIAALISQFSTGAASVPRVVGVWGGLGAAAMVLGLAVLWPAAMQARRREPREVASVG